MSILNWSIPVIVLMLFSILSVFITLFGRVQALRDGRINEHDFKTMDFCKKSNPWMETSSRHLSNLFETPTLFYVCLIIIMLNPPLMSEVYLFVLAWIYVGFKLLNSAIHLSYNNVVHRLATFLIAHTCLFTMILMTFIGIIKLH